MPPIDYNVDNVLIKTCGELYMKWREKKALYKFAKPEGLTVDVEYADTLSQSDANGRKIDHEAPVVLCLHGAPGSHRDFASLIRHLARQGKRVIVPNFPTYKLTEKSRVFRHSAQEKKEYVKDFLKAIGVKKIDLLVSHSSAVYPTALLWCESEEIGLAIGAIAFINPSGHRRIKAMRPKIVTSVFARLYQKKLGRVLMRVCGTTVLSITGCPVRPDNMDQVILSATTMVYSKFRYLSESLVMMREKALPLFMVLSENDKLVDTDISYEMAELLGASEESYSVYNRTGVEKERASNCHPWIVVLPEGGHYSFIKHPQVVNEAVGEFFASVQSEQCQTVDSTTVESNLQPTTPLKSDLELLDGVRCLMQKSLQNNNDENFVAA